MTASKEELKNQIDKAFIKTPSDAQGRPIIPEINGEDGQKLTLTPLALNAKCVMGPNELIKNMRYAMSHGYPQFYKRDPHHGEIVLCGSGPSIENNVEDIKALYANGHPVMAIKSTHDWLVDHGIRPQLALAVDPTEKIARLYQNPQPDCVYLIATQCHPEVYKALAGYNVVIWNAYTKKAEGYWKNYVKRKRRVDKVYFINGGSTSGLRAITMAYLMGYRKVHLFGFDSCLRSQTDNLLKISGERNTKQTCVVVVEDRHFFCDPAMACQGNEFMKQVRHTPRLQVRVWGDGFIPYVSKLCGMQDDPQHVLEGEDWYALDSPLRGTMAPDPIQLPGEIEDNGEIGMVA